MNNNKTLIVRIVRSVKALLLGTVVAMTCSCDDFLTILPTDKIVWQDFWKGKEDVENAVAESYRQMAHWDFLSRVVVWGELRGDNVVEGNYGSNTDIKNIMEIELQPSNQYASWAPFYSVINNCNQVLKYAPGVLDEDPDFTQGDLDVVVGEMKAIRALCHFYLVRTFRDIPLLTEAMIDDSQDLYQNQVDPIVALDSCLNDLYEAERLVLTTGNYPTGDFDIYNKNMGRITKDAVRTMIADVLLWKGAFLESKAGGDDNAGMECYSEAIRYCDLVLDTRMSYAKVWMEENRYDNLTLHDSYPIIYAAEQTGGYEANKRFTHMPYAMQFGGGIQGCNSPIESIFEIQHAETEQGANYEVPYFYSYSNDGKDCLVGMVSASEQLAQRGKLYKRTDFRRVNYINAQDDKNSVDKYHIIKYGHYAATETGASATVFNFGKLEYSFTQCNTADGKSGGIKDMRYLSRVGMTGNVHWIVYRISDVMLMKAEALALRNVGEDGNEAVKLVKAVYNRSQMGYESDNGSPLGLLDPQVDLFEKVFADYGIQKLVLEERQRELAFEGKRWYDLVRVALREKATPSSVLKRYNYFSNKFVGSTGQYESKMSTIDHLFFPIAEREIKIYPELVQNAAWGTKDLVETN